MIENQHTRPLTAEETDEVAGGFACGGLCIAGAAFAAGFLFGAGVAVGQSSKD